MNEIKLPPLPKSGYVNQGLDFAYTVEQMQAYATAAIQADRAERGVPEPDLGNMGEPVAWEVYVEEFNNSYVVDDLNDAQLVSDCTNHDAVVTPLYATPPAHVEVLKQCLEALEDNRPDIARVEPAAYMRDYYDKAIAAARQITGEKA